MNSRKNEECLGLFFLVVGICLELSECKAGKFIIVIGVSILLIVLKYCWFSHISKCMDVKYCVISTISRKSISGQKCAC
jgi:NhaP-type Na+/H+ or K+/H+ antiporter